MFFIAVAYVVLVAMATKIFHRFILGKVKVGLYFYLTIRYRTIQFEHPSSSNSQNYLENVL